MWGKKVYTTYLWWNWGLFIWLVVSTPLKNISQLGWLFPIYGKIKNVPNHQPVMIVLPTKKPNYILWDSAVAIFASGSHVTEQSWVPRTTSCERAVLGAILSSSVFNSSVYQLNENCSKIISHSMLDKVIKILNRCIYIYIHIDMYMCMYIHIYIYIYKG